MSTFEIQLKALIKCLSEQKIKYIILGGLAVSIYGEPRLTSDIDLTLSRINSGDSQATPTIADVDA